MEGRTINFMWYVYILKSRIKNYLYVGSTNDVDRRVDEHKSGLVKSTKPYLPIKLVAYIAVANEFKAHNLEKYFKTGSSKAILKKRILADETPQGV